MIWSLWVASVSAADASADVNGSNKPSRMNIRQKSFLVVGI